MIALRPVSFMINAATSPKLWTSDFSGTNRCLLLKINFFSLFRHELHTRASELDITPSLWGQISHLPATWIILVVLKRVRSYTHAREPKHVQKQLLASSKLSDFWQYLQIRMRYGPESLKPHSRICKTCAHAVGALVRAPIARKGWGKRQNSSKWLKNSEKQRFWADFR